MTDTSYLFKPFILLGLVLATASCTSINATRNSPIDENTRPVATKASFKIDRDRGVARDKGLEKTLVILALSGGGSRAAYWSSEIMLDLEKVFKDSNTDNLNLLKEVDVISSVSGGSLPAAYYVISKDKLDTTKVQSDRDWDTKTVRDLMSNDYIIRWFYNWFWPSNIVQYWFTGYDRSDIMAQTFADNLFDVSITGWDLKFKDINPERPNLILNATNGTGDNFGESFTFTDEVFHKELKSQLSEYDIAWAVMATASFPAVFNYMTLEDFNATNGEKYVHVFDGGNTDNLGLKSAEKVIRKNLDKYNKFVVILIDAFTHTAGIDRTSPDARKYFDFVVDTNFLDSTDSLLTRARKEIISNMKQFMKNLEVVNHKKSVFYHIRFDDVREQRKKHNLNKIATNFKIGKDQQRLIEEAASELIVAQNKCLKLIKDVILDKDKLGNKFSSCSWRNPGQTAKKNQSGARVASQSAR